MQFSELYSYKKLKSLDPILFSQVEKVYNMVKDTINGISGCFGNFTMHDIGHSVRVAHYMEQLAFGIDNNMEERASQYNAAELTILLLSALLHDIGMFIRSIDKENIRNNIIEYKKEELTFDGVLEAKGGNEDEAIKEIIRRTHAARVKDFLCFPMDDGGTISDVLKIDNNYPYDEDIALICQSHGENYDYIKTKLVPSITKGSYEYNQQYFAVLLRIADYLDLDKQRTPILWFKTMGINGFSKSEWEMHFLVSNETKLRIYMDNKMQIYFDGKSSNAKIHRKYLRYIDDLREELENADALLNFEHASEKYKLNVTTKIEDRVRTEGFQYSDLRLSLDYAAITELLMGKNIYGDNRLGLRELIQNSIDACKLMKEIGDDIGRVKPEIYILYSEKNNYVKIKDTGIGMTLDVIKNHFLNIGKSYYKSNEYLFHNYKYKPIGQYGIGFLACFLLSDNVVVKTKHYSRNEVYQIELEKSSEYVVTNTELGSFTNGTEIKLDYDKFFDVFETKEKLIKFVSKYFYTEIPIKIINADETNEIYTIVNANETYLNQFVNYLIEQKDIHPNIFDMERHSDNFNGRIVLYTDKKIRSAQIKKISNKTVYLYDNALKKFNAVTTIPDGYYNVISYGQISENDYKQISDNITSEENKSKLIFECIKKMQTESLLFINRDDKFPYPRYFVKQDEKICSIFENTGLKFYKELFYYPKIKHVFATSDSYVELHIIEYSNEFEQDDSYLNSKNRSTNLYYKDILVQNHNSLLAFVPYRYRMRGIINYKKPGLKLDVSRNEVIDGWIELNSDFNIVVLKLLIENRIIAKDNELLLKMLNCCRSMNNE